MENRTLEYNDLLYKFVEYKNVVNKEIEQLKIENKKLGKSLAVLYNVVEISGYVNSFISKDNLVGLINDMIIGVLGATKATIYLVEDGKMTVKATNDSIRYDEKNLKYKDYINYGQACVINNVDTKNNPNQISSILGIPITMADKSIGYIVAEHTLYNFFGEEHKIFLAAIANQIAIAIENSRLYKQLQIAAQVDSLLNIYNRRTFFEIVEAKIKAKGFEDYAIVMMDLDNFKSINDTLGHQFGDEVLVQTTNVIKKHLKKDDVIARYGGEEIIIYINNAKEVNEVCKRIDNIRFGIENNRINRGDKVISVTSSFGISLSTENRCLLDQNINIADKLLYKAKYSGKNRVVSSNL